MVFDWLPGSSNFGFKPSASEIRFLRLPNDPGLREIPISSLEVWEYSFGINARVILSDMFNDIAVSGVWEYIWCDNILAKVKIASNQEGSYL